MKIIETKTKKFMISPEANYVFNKENGDMLTWGKTQKEDAVKFPAPTILDLEVTTKCTGVGGVLCPFCYKANNPKGHNMTLETFKKIFHKLPKSLTQIAFGADSKGITNPYLFDMMNYSRENGIIPNITVAEVSDEVADKLASVCGAVAISRYHDPDICYDSVKKLTDRGMRQVNIHMMISEETFERAKETIIDVSEDERLKGLNAIVFLSLKTKGRGESFKQLSQGKFNELVEMCETYGIGYGFDSCSSKKFFDSLDDEGYKLYSKFIQPCESTLESSYINAFGDFYPCSFTEGTEGWENGIAVAEAEDFIKDVWNHPRVEEFRSRLLATTACNKYRCRECPIYVI